ncbi:hypothetical protein BWK57_12415 [Flavobacterium columnare]|uniref:hypothetical protein n=1 Tax=Flavobacterium columnare TaxID=996 RepID=UPI000CDAE7E2|nr:hypothetical protein [Flavobacterium columnare]POR20782.1 hypothetical protein BWK57_12415 [Flavobacterium columnare]
MKTILKRILKTILFFAGLNISAQVGVGTLTPNPSAMMEIKSNDKGLLITRVTLTDPNSLLPITGTGEESLLVYNTNDTKLMTKGYYYWDNKKWTRLANYNDVSNLINNTNYTAIVKANETVTTLVDIGGGKYEYTNEKGVKTIINITSSIVNNLSQLFTNNAFLTQLTNVINQTSGIVHYDGDNFTFIDKNGTNQTINFSTIVKANETVTTLVDIGGGKYEYTNEKGVKTIINITSSIVNNLSQLFTNNDFLTQLTNVINQTSGIVHYDGDNFTFIDKNGTNQTINFSTIVKANETVTNITQNKDSSLISYTNEKGITQTANVCSFNSNNVLKIGTDGGVYLSKYEFKANETITNLDQDTLSGTISYTNEKGAVKKAIIKSVDPRNILKNGIDGGLIFTQYDIKNYESKTRVLDENQGFIFYNEDDTPYQFSLYDKYTNLLPRLERDIPYNNFFNKLVKRVPNLTFWNGESLALNPDYDNKIIYDNLKTISINNTGNNSYYTNSMFDRKNQDVDTFIITGTGIVNLFIYNMSNSKESMANFNNGKYMAKDIKIILFNDTDTPLVVNVLDHNQNDANTTFIYKNKKIINNNKNLDGVEANFKLKACKTCVNEIYTVTLSSHSISPTEAVWFVSNSEMQ